MIEKNVKLIVVDSVAALVRDEFEKGNIHRRQVKPSNSYLLNKIIH